MRYHLANSKNRNQVKGGGQFLALFSSGVNRNIDQICKNPIGNCRYLSLDNKLYFHYPLVENHLIIYHVLVILFLKGYADVEKVE